jgi:hypothetical protein
LFASKVADSISEGAQAATDKEGAAIAGAISAGEAEIAPSVSTHVPTSADLAEEEQLDMEEVLGGRVRRGPVAVETPASVDVPAVDIAKSH